ncbi:hypothetical protein [Burkholderia sp. Bp8986]|uniref:hypothetical protein n=1 Tax=Burkholderia sp. Bp8986 TaxID=2184550 RepID=UPI000F5B3918|nr:hypothetical protein [Burkholderia sp. Bp8986]
MRTVGFNSGDGKGRALSVGERLVNISKIIDGDRRSRICNSSVHIPISHALKQEFECLRHDIVAIDRRCIGDCLVCHINLEEALPHIGRCLIGSTREGVEYLRGIGELTALDASRAYLLTNLTPRARASMVAAPVMSRFDSDILLKIPMFRENRAELNANILLPLSEKCLTGAGAIGSEEISDLLVACKEMAAGAAAKGKFKAAKAAAARLGTLLESFDESACVYLKYDIEKAKSEIDKIIDEDNEIYRRRGRAPGMIAQSDIMVPDVHIEFVDACKWGAKACLAAAKACEWSADVCKWVAESCEWVGLSSFAKDALAWADKANLKAAEALLLAADDYLWAAADYAMQADAYTWDRLVGLAAQANMCAAEANSWAAWALTKAAKATEATEAITRAEQANEISAKIDAAIKRTNEAYDRVVENAKQIAKLPDTRRYTTFCHILDAGSKCPSRQYAELLACLADQIGQLPAQDTRWENFVNSGCGSAGLELSSRGKAFCRIIDSINELPLEERTVPLVRLAVQIEELPSDVRDDASTYLGQTIAKLPVDQVNVVMRSVVNPRESLLSTCRFLLAFG